jgi:photosystem II stability/assembly factor-like uncharacterized protein
VAACSRGACKGLKSIALTCLDCSAAVQGAIYVTDNTAYTWKAAVQETVDATLNRTVSSGQPAQATAGVAGTSSGDALSAVHWPLST